MNESKQTVLTKEEALNRYTNLARFRPDQALEIVEKMVARKSPFLIHENISKVGDVVSVRVTCYPEEETKLDLPIVEIRLRGGIFKTCFVLHKGKKVRVIEGAPGWFLASICKR